MFRYVEPPVIGIDRGSKWVATISQCLVRSKKAFIRELTPVGNMSGAGEATAVIQPTKGSSDHARKAAIEDGRLVYKDDLITSISMSPG